MSDRRWNKTPAVSFLKSLQNKKEVQMGKIFSKRTLKDSIAELFRCLYDLVALRSVRSGDGCTVKSENKYSPSVERLLELCNHIKGWEIDSQNLYERDGYVAQLWTDKRTCNKVVVILKQNCKRGCFPVLYVPVPEEAMVEAVLSDALCKARNQCEMQIAA